VDEAPVDVICATETMIGTTIMDSGTSRPSINHTICTNANPVEAMRSIMTNTTVSPTMTTTEAPSASNTTRTTMTTTTTTTITTSEKQVSIDRISLKIYSTYGKIIKMG
jgi:hypothetical protein